MRDNPGLMSVLAEVHHLPLSSRPFATRYSKLPSCSGNFLVMISAIGNARERVRAHRPPSAGQNNRNANIAVGPGRIEQNCIITAPHPHIDARLTELEVAQNDLIQKRRQAWIAQSD